MWVGIKKTEGFKVKKEVIDATRVRKILKTARTSLENYKNVELVYLSVYIDDGGRTNIYEAYRRKEE